MSIHLVSIDIRYADENTVELQWLEHFWNHENMFETGIGQAIEYCARSVAPGQEA